MATSTRQIRISQLGRMAEATHYTDLTFLLHHTSCPSILVPALGTARAHCTSLAPLLVLQIDPIVYGRHRLQVGGRGWGGSR